MIQWVVDGNLVENNTNVALLKDSTRPSDLNGKLILGAYQLATKSWWVMSNKLTNMNIFSSLLSVAVMQKRTRGDGLCFKEGDFLAWSEMKWELRGRAFIENMRPEEFATKPIFNFYPARLPITDCKHFCENLGTQMPSLSTKVELERLQKFCVTKMKDTPHSVWLAVNDIEEEGTA